MVAVGLALPVAGWFVGPIMTKIINALSDYLKEQVEWQTGMKKELERLRENQPKIHAVVFAANQAQIFDDQNPALNTWIWQLRDALDEANDVLDEFEYIKLKEQLPKNTEEIKLKSVKKGIVKITERALKRDPTLKRLKKAVKKLDKVSADVTPFFLLVKDANQELQEQQRELFEARETGFLPTNDLIGRDKAKEFVVQWLRKPSNEPQETRYKNISLLSIVGHGGMGKTALLQHVYEDQMITGFDLKIWVCVSINFEVKKVIADMLSTLNERPRLDDPLATLQKSLRTKILNKKFLLVLDNIWGEEENRDISKWEKVLAPLSFGSLGSKILVTTRMDSVTQMFENVIKKKIEHLRLDGLEEEECLELLNTHAFGVDQNLNGQKKSKLKLITAEIVKKLSGSPLAAKVIGGTLNSRLDEDHWRAVLDSVTEIIKSGQNDIMHILGLSYIHLPQRLKRCFTFCSIFPQDYEFDKVALVQMWNALGFIQLSDIQGETMEDIGGRYFDDLVKKSFFDKFETNIFGRYYKIHDLIHQLAQSLSKEECLRVEDSTKLPSRIPKTLRHLSLKVINPEDIKNIGLGQFKYLHSLFLFYKGSNKQDLCNALIEIFNASRSLRLLYVSSTYLKMILEEIGNLIHLRYLSISSQNLTMLPRSLSNLNYLQYIICDGRWPRSESEVDDYLPRDMNNLSNLRYINLHECYISSMRGIGKLKYLQELDKFQVKDVSGYRIRELENMNDLCKLVIECLENIKDAEEACSAKLCEKRRLTDLTLRWCHPYLRNINLYENVLDNLQPPKCLRNMTMWNYIGARTAIWMNNVNLICNIENIALNFCSKWKTLPPFGQLPFLKSLRLLEMPKIKWLESKFNGNDKYDAFPSLERLTITRLEALEDWFEAGVSAEDDGCFFPRLKYLKILNCPKLKELPSFFLSYLFAIYEIL